MSSKSSETYPLLASSEPRPIRPLTIRSVRERRLNEFVGGQYGKYNLASMLFENKIDGQEDEYKGVFKLEKWSPSIGAKPSWKEAKDQKFIECKKGEAFGPSWTNHWMKVHLRIPADWKKKERLELEFDPSCEALIFNEKGEALQGITGGFGGDRRVDLPIKKEWLKKDVILFYVEISCNGMFGVDSTGNGSDPDPNRFFVLNSCDLVIKRPSVWSLMWDFNILKQLVEELPKDSILQNKSLWVCNEIINVFKKDNLESVEKGRILAEEILGKNWEKDIEKKLILESSSNSRKKDSSEEEDSVEKTIVWSLGHTHIDTAWLWPFSVTQQKVARSWSTQLSLMERYPEHQFTASTAQQYQWLEQLYPELFERVKASIGKKFQAVGGSWVENDANLPSGEAFVRQFVYGQRYFLSRFGQRSKVFWLPDTFGYNAQIPQLARGSGMDYFFTQKLSWSNINRFPHHSMQWVGLDGTQIISHLTPVDNYDSQCGVNDILKAVKNNKNLDVQPTALHLFGFGDGGGGPTAPMLESLRRIKAVNENGGKEVPKLKVTKSAVDFFENLRKITKNGSRLPSWEGELYLEFHRGVFTSHGSIKRWNRKMEILMHNLEWIATLASIQTSSTYKLPKKEIDSLWEPLLTNQFHDVLPGSSIRLVYDDAERIYREIARKGMKLLAEATRALSVNFTSSTSSPPSLESGSNNQGSASLSLMNTLDIPRRELVTVSLEHEGISTDQIQALQGKSVQILDSGKKAILLFDDSLSTGLAKVIQPIDSLSIMRKLEAVSITSEGHNVFTMQNSMISIKISNGRISSIYDRQSRREILQNDRTAGLTICEDYPPQFDAWETEMTSLETEEELKFDRVRISEKGPWRSSLTLISTFGKSQVELTITLDAIPANSNSIKGNARSFLRFDANIDWFEKHRFLRFSLPTSLRSDFASYETQFGITNRPTSRNTSWEAAKFEVCGHKFSDLSEGSGSFGVALLSDSKYGYSTEGGTMRLSLLKAPTYPDAHTDEGNHRFSFGIYPHPNGLAGSDVIDVARIFNNPLEIYPSLNHEFDQLNIKEHFETFFESSKSLNGLMKGFENPISIKSSVNTNNNGSNSVILDTIKRGEQDFDYDSIKAIKGKTVVVRLYESLGSKTEARLSTSLSIKSVALCNLLEDDLPKEEQILKVQNVNSGNDKSLNVIPLSFRGFEVKTVKLYLK